MRKKIVSIFLLMLIALPLLASGKSFHAADDLMNFFPNNNPYNIGIVHRQGRTGVDNPVGPIVPGMVGSYWALEFMGARWFLRGGNANIFSTQIDYIAANAGVVTIPASGFGGSSGSAYGNMWFNDTNIDVLIDLQGNHRGLAQGGTPTEPDGRNWYWLDETGQMVMFEQNVRSYHIISDSQDRLAPDWRFMTADEITLYNELDAAGEIPWFMMNTQVRGIRANNARGYMLEPIRFAQSMDWGVNPATLDPSLDLATEDPVSFLLPELFANFPDLWPANPTRYDTVNLRVPAGWILFSIGALDNVPGTVGGQGGANTDIAKWVNGLHRGILTTDVGTPVFEFGPARFGMPTSPANAALGGGYGQHPQLFGLNVLPDTPGIDVVLPFGVAFAWPGYNVIRPFYRSMTVNELGHHVVSAQVTTGYSVTIYNEAGQSEVIDFVWDGTAMTPSAAPTLVNVNSFGSAYRFVYSATANGFTLDVEVRVSVGSVPPRFIGIPAFIFMNNTDFDVEEYIRSHFRADNGESGAANRDLTDRIVISWNGFNPFSPQPGAWKLDLTVTKEVIIAASITPGILLSEITYGPAGAATNVLSTPIVKAAITAFSGTGFNGLDLATPASPDYQTVFIIDTQAKWNATLASGVLPGGWTANQFVYFRVAANGQILQMVQNSNFQGAPGAAEVWASQADLWNERFIPALNANPVNFEGGEIVVFTRRTGAGNQTVAGAHPLNSLRAGDYFNIWEYAPIYNPEQRFYIDATTTTTLQVEQVLAPRIEVIQTQGFQIEFSPTQSAAIATQRALANVRILSNPDTVQLQLSQPARWGQVGTFNVTVTAANAGSETTVVTFPVEIVPIRATQENVDNLVNQIAILEGEIEDLLADIGDLNAEITSLLADIAALNSEIADLTSELGKAGADIASLTASLATASTAIATLTTQLGNAQAAISQLTSDLAAANSTITTLQTQLADALARLDALEAPSGGCGGNSNVALLFALIPLALGAVSLVFFKKQ